MSLGVSISDAEEKNKPLACSQELHLLPCADESQAGGNALVWLSLKLARSLLIFKTTPLSQLLGFDDDCYDMSG